MPNETGLRPPPRHRGMAGAGGAALRFYRAIFGERGEPPMAMGRQDPAAVRHGGRLRAGDADRDRVMGLLTTAYTQGRLTGEELDARTGLALAARTYAELDALTDDLPAMPAPDGPPVPSQATPISPPAPSAPSAWSVGWRLAKAATISAGCVGLAFVLAVSGNLIDNSWNGPGPGPHHGWTRLLLLLAVSALFTAVLVMGHAVVTTLEERSSRRRQSGTE